MGSTPKTTAAEDGRDIEQGRCIEAMAEAMRPYLFGESGKALCNYDGQDVHNQEAARKEASLAINAAIASGYVVVNNASRHS